MALRLNKANKLVVAKVATASKKANKASKAQALTYKGGALKEVFCKAFFYNVRGNDVVTGKDTLRKGTLVKGTHGIVMLQCDVAGVKLEKASVVSFKANGKAEFKDGRTVGTGKGASKQFAVMHVNGINYAIGQASFNGKATLFNVELDTFAGQTKKNRAHLV